MINRKTDSPIGLAMAGHAFRVSGNENKAAEYDNPLTDFVNLMIAECKAKQNIATANKNPMLKGSEDTPDQIYGPVPGKTIDLDYGDFDSQTIINEGKMMIYKLKKKPNIDWQSIATRFGYDDWKLMLKERYHYHKSINRVGNELDVSSAAIAYTLESIGEKLIYKNNNAYHRFTQPFLDLAKDNDLSTMTATEIANILGCTDSNIYLLSKRTGIKFKYRRKKKEQKGEVVCNQTL